MNIIARKIRHGDAISIIAPSHPVIGEGVYELEETIKVLEGMGYVVKKGKYLYSNSLKYGAKKEEKLFDLKEAFLDKDVKMIWFARGGENANALLSEIDYDLIKENPKIVMGYSNSTFLLNAIRAKTGLVVYHGPTARSAFVGDKEYNIEMFNKRFVKGDMSIDCSNVIENSNNLNSFEGELIGGSLIELTMTYGTEYLSDFDGKVLFFEARAKSNGEARVSSYLNSLKQKGAFERLKGIIVGYYDKEIELDEILMEVIGKEYNIPIIRMNNFGHLHNNMILPIGAYVKFDHNKMNIEVVGKCISN